MKIAISTRKLTLINARFSFCNLSMLHRCKICKSSIVILKPGITGRWHNVDKYLQRTLEKSTRQVTLIYPIKNTLPFKNSKVNILYLHRGKQFELMFKLRTKWPREIWELRKVRACCKLSAAGGLKQGWMYKREQGAFYPSPLARFLLNAWWFHTLPIGGFSHASKVNSHASEKVKSLTIQ